jgi:hypothetical protein
VSDLFSSSAPPHIDAHGYRYYREDLQPVAANNDDSGFDSFWGEVPKGFKIGKEEARREFAKLKADDRQAAINSVVPFYSHWVKSNPDANKLHPCRYLKNRRWTDEGWETQKQPAARDKDQFDADTIKKGHSFLCTNMSAERGRYLISKRLVTEAECKAVGIL